MLRVAIGDDSNATLVLRFFHFRAAQVAQFAPGARVRCYGTPRLGQHGLEIVHPSYRVVGDDEAGALGDSLDPVYPAIRSEEHTSELQSLMRISYAVFCLQHNNTTIN